MPEENTDLRLDLSNLHLNGLQYMAALLDAMAEAGDVLQQAGVDPIFNLMAESPVIRLDGPSFARSVEPMEKQLARILKDKAPEPSETDAAPKSRPNAWTDDEEAKAVELVAIRLAYGDTQQKALADAASQIGRPLPGFQFKCRSLKPRIRARLTELQATMAEDAPKLIEPKQPDPETPDPAPVHSSRDAGGLGGGDATSSPAEPVVQAKDAPGAVVPGAGASPYAAILEHLSSLKPDPKWPFEKDRELIQLAEELRWPMDDICLEMQITSDDAKKRFAILTRDKTISRADLWAAMQMIQPAEKQAAE